MMTMNVVRKQREINKGRGNSKNKENLAKLEAYIKLNDIKSDFQDNRRVSK
jgi:hypothetical protein